MSPVIIDAVEASDLNQSAESMRRVSDPGEIEELYTAYLSDESRLGGGHADEIVFAGSETQIVELLKEASSKRLGVTVSSARTGIVGGAVPFGGMLLILENMNRFVDVKWLDNANKWSLTVQPGLSLDEIQQALDRSSINFVCISDQTKSDEFLSQSRNWYYAPDPTEKSAHIGGTVATNASGARSFRFGQTRDHIIRLRVVLADGMVLEIPRGKYLDKTGNGFIIRSGGNEKQIPHLKYQFPDVKNTAGYYNASDLDLIDLFIGSEGTLGIITEIEILLQPKAEALFCGVSYFPSEREAVDFVAKIRENARDDTNIIHPSALEYYGPNALELLREHKAENPSVSEIPDIPFNKGAAVYFEQDTTEEEIESVFMAYDEVLTPCGSSMEETWGGMNEHEREQMAAFRHMLPEIINGIIGQRQTQVEGLHKIGTDLVVPDQHLAEILTIYREKLNQSGIQFVIFGHIGQNHLHINLLPKSSEDMEFGKKLYADLARTVVKIGGSVSGEHGIGKIKRNMMKIQFNPEEIEAMRTLKSAFDPEFILGRGNLFPAETS